MSENACLDEATVLGMMGGSLAPPAMRDAESHVARCAECRQLVSALAKSSLLLRVPASPALAPTEPQSGSGEGSDRGKRRDPTPPVRAGEVLAGKYQVDRVIGAGGMGVVVAATHVALGQKVAIKFLLGEAVEAPGAATRFLREARAAVQIQGEHVARVIDVGTMDGTGAPYMVMELLRGADLAEIIRGNGPLPVDVTIDYVLQACEAIAEAHALGIVHRDLKPANLFLTSRPDGSPLVKVLDFGISKQQRAPTGLTSGEVMMGSPRYMSPEQMRSTRDVDERTDVWALGTILFELLAGKPVFESDTMAGLCAAIQTDPAPPLKSVRPDAPDALADAVARCLEKDRARRIASVAELAQALAPVAPSRAQVHIERIVRLLGGPRASALHVSPVSGPTPSAPPLGAATAGSFGGTSPGSRALPIGLFSVLLGLLVVGVIAGAVAVRRANQAKATATVASAIAERSPSPTPSPTPTPIPGPTPSLGPTPNPNPNPTPDPTPTPTPTPTQSPTPAATGSGGRRAVPAPRKPVASAVPAPESTSDMNRKGLLDRK